MTKQLFILFFLLSPSIPLLAQQESAQSQHVKQQLRQQYLANDTAQAIITLYGRRQGGGVGWIFGSALAGARALTASPVPSSNPYVQQENNTAAGLVALVPLVGYGVSKLVRFSNANLEKTLATYAAGQPLPRSLRRKLKPRLFAQPIIDYKPVTQKSN